MSRWSAHKHLLLSYQQCKTNFTSLFFFSCLVVWVNTVWDLDFTEAEPLDPKIEREITEDGLNAFTCLYRALSPFTVVDNENRRVRLITPGCRVPSKDTGPVFCCYSRLSWLEFYKNIWRDCTRKSLSGIHNRIFQRKPITMFIQKSHVCVV